MSAAPAPRSARSSRGPVRGAERALAPDLARGLMLLLIAVANTPFYLYAADQGTYSAHPEDGSAVDLAVDAVVLTAVDGRVYPMFAFLFGYGMVQLYRRQVEAGADDRAARRVLRRRNAWLVAFGFLHAALLWSGDILGAYGLVGLVVGGLFLRRRDRTLLAWAGAVVGVLVLTAALGVVGAAVLATQPAPPPTPGFDLGDAVDTGQESYPASVAGRLGFWVLLTLFQGLGLVVPVALLLAFWAGRRQVLERPAAHLPLLRRTAVAGLGVAWAAGALHGLDHAGVLGVPDHVGWVFVATQTTSGLFGGLGYVALFALLGERIARRPPPYAPVVVALTAVGKRSLTCYLAQSVLCAPVLAAWGLGLGAALSSWSMAAYAVGVWLVTVALAYGLERTGGRGPAEALLRRLTYG